MPEFRFGGYLDDIPAALRPGDTRVGAALAAAPVTAGGKVISVGDAIARGVAVITRVASQTISDWTAVVGDGANGCVPADPFDASHAGVVLGVVAKGVASGSEAQIQAIGDLVGSAPHGFALGTVLCVGPSGALAAELADGAAWRQLVGSATAAAGIVVALGEASVVEGGTALIAEGGYASVTNFSRPIVEAGSPADVLGALGAGQAGGPALLDGQGRVPTATPPLSAAGSPSDPTGPALNLPYLLGLRNKTVNPRRYLNWAGAMADLGDGCTLDIPAGNFLASSPATKAALTNKTFAIRGEGMGVTTLIFPSGNGLDIKQDSYFRRMSIQGLSLNTRATRSGSAILVERPFTISSHELGITIRDVEMMGEDRNAHAWANGIEVIHGWNTIIDNCLFNGLDGSGIGNGTVAGNALVLRGASTPVTVSKFQVYLAENAVYAPAGTNNEGLIISEPQFVGVNNGVLLEDGANAPLVEWRGGHCAAYKFGIRNVNRNATKLSGVTFYKRQDSTSNWVGAQIEYSPHSDIIGCGFYGYRAGTDGAAAGGSATGVVSGNSDGVHVALCDFIACDIAHNPTSGKYFGSLNRSNNTATWNNNSSVATIDPPLTY